MKIFLNNIRFIILMGVILSFAGCIEDDAELPKVVAGFTYTVNETGTVTFLNTSTKATKFVWDFGDEETSTEINPVKTYIPGTFFVSLTASNVAGASNVFKDTLTIVIKDKITLPITFDNTNVDYEVTTFNGASFAIVDNPNVSGTNNKATKVGALTNSGVAFEGMFMDLATQIDLASKKTIAMNVLATAPVTLLLKLEEGTAAAVEVTANHGGTGWENLKFDFTSSAKYSRLTLFVDGPGTTAGVFHIDDIEQKTTEALTAPTTAAPTPPTRAASDVISIYGGTYTNLAGVNYSPNWGQSPPVVVNPSFNPGNGNLALAYTNLNFQGTEFASVDASSMEFLHVDIWVASGTNRQIKVSPINNGAGATGAAEVQVNIPLTPGAWNSVDLPKSSFTGMTWNAIQQMIFNGQFNGDGSANTTSRVDIYLDNIYFYKTAGGGGSCPAPPAGEFIVDGGFEANAGCWELIATQSGTSSTIVTNVNNGGTNSARIKTAPAGNPAIKQTRFGVGAILPNTTYVVKFDVRQDAADPVASGAVFKVAAFSEAAEGSGTGAVRHDLVPGDGSVPSAWTTRTLTFTTPGAAANVAGGVSLLIELVGGGPSTTGTIYIDNVSLTKQ
jgi:PKD domain